MVEGMLVGMVSPWLMLHMMAGNITGGCFSVRGLVSCVVTMQCNPPLIISYLAPCADISVRGV